MYWTVYRVYECLGCLPTCGEHYCSMMLLQVELVLHLTVRELWAHFIILISTCWAHFSIHAGHISEMPLMRGYLYQVRYNVMIAQC